MNFFSLAKRIKRPLILDGAMGSMLQNMGLKPYDSLWMSYANIEFSEKVFEIHKRYINAGADIITSNTFRTNPAVLKSYSKVKRKELVKKSVSIALNARDDLPVFVAGSNAPAEDCYQVKRTLTKKELLNNHQEHIDLLMNSGCDFILNETQSHFDEIKIICQHCKKENIPYVLSFFFNPNLKLLSGEDLFNVIKYVLNYNPLALGFNCIMPSTFSKLLFNIDSSFNWGFYLNCGNGNFSDKIIKCGVLPKDYLKIVKPSLSKNPSFIGSCCGSSPSHIKEIKRLING